MMVTQALRRMIESRGEKPVLIEESLVRNSWLARLLPAHRAVAVTARAFYRARVNLLGHVKVTRIPREAA